MPAVRGQKLARPPAVLPACMWGGLTREKALAWLGIRGIIAIWSAAPVGNRAIQANRPNAVILFVSFLLTHTLHCAPVSSTRPLNMDSILRFLHPVLPGKQLRKQPVKIVLNNTAYVLFRDNLGQAQCLADRCPHRYAPLSAGRVRDDGTLACPYHGWYFDGQGSGCSPTIPNLRCQTESLQTVERHGYVWIGNRDVSADTIPCIDDPLYKLAGADSTVFNAPLHVVLDNFSEDEHTPFVHHRLGWSESEAPLVKFNSTNHPDHIETHYVAPQRSSMILILKGDIFHNDWKTYFDAPRIEYHLHWTNSTGTKRRGLEMFALIYFVPETDTVTRVNSMLFVKYTGFRWIMRPWIRAVSRWVVRHEIIDDANFVPLIADTPFEMRGMKLCRFDKPLVHNHRLLNTIYWGRPDTLDPNLAAPAADETL